MRKEPCQRHAKQPEQNHRGVKAAERKGQHRERDFRIAQVAEQQRNGDQRVAQNLPLIKRLRSADFLVLLEKLARVFVCDPVSREYGERLPSSTSFCNRNILHRLNK
jgi:hypothetical protein